MPWSVNIENPSHNYIESLLLLCTGFSYPFKTKFVLFGFKYCLEEASLLN